MLQPAQSGRPPSLHVDCRRGAGHSSESSNVAPNDEGGMASATRGGGDNSLAESMGYLVRRTFRAFTRTLELRLAEYEISISMWFFLRLLWEQDGLTQREISEELGLTPPTTVSAIDALEKRGYVE